ncbi:hypothetical protein [Microbacterium sp. NIBRBAC000506063]|uniref:hypothetical protein n=1 Tax=Microbacterium sp. NIBRBAC000506063 TaxID=2734618 RepID=UPI001BB55E72|nr:hypothetical protein [Microbacterium sp. NIBRBAC000506063]QTV79782.1 hypothetical protein KAE78_00350 [Microbacterium sp. NIBRBAC000506063]
MTLMLLISASCVVELSHPALGRESRMRSFVPKISSISNICQAFFENRFDALGDTLEQIFRFALIIGYGFDIGSSS